MKPVEWQLQNAKNRFSELVKKAEEGVHQVVTRNGKPVVCVIDIETYKKRISRPKRGKKDIILNRPHREIELDLSRNGDGGREVDL